MLPADTLRAITELTTKSLTPTVLPLDRSDPTAAYVWNPSTGKIEVQAVRLPRRNSTVLTLESFADAVELYGNADPASAIWLSLGIGGGKAVLVIDDAECRMDLVTFPISISPLMKTLSIGHEDASQSDMIRWIHHDLHCAGLDPDSFELAVSSLVWRQEDSEGKTVTQAKSTMGRSITAEVRGELPVPKRLTLLFNPLPSIHGYDNDVRVECSVFVDVEEKTLSVLPLPGEIEAAMSETLNAMAEVIRSAIGEHSPDIPVLCGTP